MDEAAAGEVEGEVECELRGLISEVEVCCCLWACEGHLR